jgi:X-Pro dipeptidyl-peptidase
MTLSRTRRVALSALLGLLLVAPLSTIGSVSAAGIPQPATTTAVARSAAAPPASQPASQQRPAARPYRLQGGVTASQYSYADALRESVWVLAPDLDDDGERDRVAVDIVRPAELDGTARIPVIMDASPYYACCGRGNEGELKEYDADGNPTKVPLFYDNYFVPRGYAYAAVDMAGTNRSTGCVDEGARSDILSIKAVVDWLNGRTRAVDKNGATVRAGWTNGDSALIGKSYDGTLANGVAATGVEGLQTIVPVSAISSWYDYTRYQGLPFYYDYAAWLSAYVEQDRTEPVDCTAINQQMAAEDADETGAYTRFWSARDYREAPRPEASDVTASVLIAHGLQDTNVKGPNFSRWWQDLGRNGVTRKMILTRLGHVDPFDSDRAHWVSTLHRWFDNQLFGIRNGILREPRVDVEVRPNEWVTSDRWPMTHSRTTLHPQADGTLQRRNDARAFAALVNDPTQDEEQAVTEGPNPARLLYTTAPLSRDTRVSGTTRVRLHVTSTVPTGQVGVYLVDYGDDERVLAGGDGARTLTTESCYGDSVSYDDACYFDVERRLGVTPLQTLARGWARLDGAGGHRVTVELTPQDNLLSSGHRLGLVVVASAPDWLETVDATPSTYTVALGKTRLLLPGRVAFSSSAPGAETRAEAVPRAAALPRGTLPVHRGGPQIPW